MCDLTCVKIFLVWLSHNIVGLDLDPFREKVENHWFVLPCYMHNLAITLALEIIKIYYLEDIFSLV